MTAQPPGIIHKPAHLLQVEDGGGDALDAVDGPAGVGVTLVLHHHVLVQVELPADRRVLRLLKGLKSSKGSIQVLGWVGERKMADCCSVITDVKFGHAHLFLKV